MLAPVRVFVSTHVVSSRHSNGVFQLRAESSSFLLPGVLCEKQVGGNDGGGNDTGNNNGGGNGGGNDTGNNNGGGNNVRVC